MVNDYNFDYNVVAALIRFASLEKINTCYPQACAIRSRAKRSCYSKERKYILPVRNGMALLIAKDGCCELSGIMNFQKILQLQFSQLLRDSMGGRLQEIEILLQINLSFSSLSFIS
ncbi:hypothetical protein AVEN_150985-1 [Araneus ventricosus]|uniref:Uncharacterized protein n=1 Tax=Araneus ventricosus TaxID=182803 RepID=A0A4Y2V2Y6_ARAVE|nr:hypothetical protein AVEN_150985-1 [Araneus ventricosus]